MKVSTSFLAVPYPYDFIVDINGTDSDYLHVDFIDNKFVKGRKIPFRQLKTIPKFCTKRLDVHLMTDKLKKYIPKFSTLNCEYITFHIEATTDPIKYIDMIHSYGIKCGLAINPDTEIQEIEPYLGNVDMILVMGVEPGYGGQGFIPKVEDKIKEIRKRITFHNLKTLLSVDGGINEEVFKKVKDYIDIVVAGSFISNSDNYQEQINKLR